VNWGCVLDVNVLYPVYVFVDSRHVHVASASTIIIT